MELVEVAPGVDIDHDILAQMDFKPVLRNPRLMDARIFLPRPMNLERLLIGLSVAERISYDQGRNILFLNYEGLHLRTLEDIELVRSELETRCRAIGRRVSTVANYDGFELDPAITDAYFTMLTYMQNRYYKSVSRYTTSAFMRLKLLNALAERDLAPHVFESRDEAQAMIET
jgi:propionate CoA-transferase